MTFRVTPNNFVSEAISQARRHNENLLRLQQQISSGLRVQKPSDDPAASRSLLNQRGTDQRLDAQLLAIQSVRADLNLGVSQLLEVNKIFVRAKEIALEGNQATDATNIEVLAVEVDQLIGQLIEIANTNNDGTYLFGGAATDRKPFVLNRDATGDAVSVAYQGASDSARPTINSHFLPDQFLSGEEVFQIRQRGQTLVLGTTGAAAGAGTDSATGFGTLSVRHTSTSYAAGSGVQAGASSASGDTIVGPAGRHVLSVTDTSGTGAAGTVSLNGGPEIAFTNADADLMIVGPEGEVAYVDMTAVTPGFIGDVDMASDGTLSTDNGLSFVAIDFSANQIVRHSQTGAVTNIDSSAIYQTGSDRLEYGDTADAFQTLIQLRDDLRNARQLDSGQRHDALSRRIADVDRVRDAVLQVVGTQSVSLENLDALENRARDLQFETRRIISELESADISEAAINLQSEQNLLQFSLASTATLLDISLLDFLR